MCYFLKTSIISPCSLPYFRVGSCRCKSLSVYDISSSAVTSSDVEYLSRSTSNWPISYFVTSKSDAQNCYSSKSKKSIQILKYFESKKVQVKVKVSIHRFVL